MLSPTLDWLTQLTSKFSRRGEPGRSAHSECAACSAASTHWHFRGRVSARESPTVAPACPQILAVKIGSNPFPARLRTACARARSESIVEARQLARPFCRLQPVDCKADSLSL